MASQGIGDLPPGAYFEIGSKGHVSLQFNLKEKRLTRWADYTFKTGVSGHPAVIAIIDAQGSGRYSTDGEELVVSDLVETVNQVLSAIEGSGITVNQTPNTSTCSFFDTSATGSGMGDLSACPQAVTAQCVCTLEITHQVRQFADQSGQKILPTPVPTPSPQPVVLGKSPNCTG